MDKNMVRTNRMLSFFYAVLGKVDKQLEQFLIRFVFYQPSGKNRRKSSL